MVPDEYLASTIRDYEEKISEELVRVYCYSETDVKFYRSLIRGFARTAVQDYQSVRRTTKQIVEVLETA